MKKLLCIAAALISLLTTSTIFARLEAGSGPQVLWGVDFENDGQPTFRARCDADATTFTEYKGFNNGVDGKTPYTGITISVNGKTKYYIYSPNPDSMSPITFSFMRNKSGSFEEVHREERDRQLSIDAPNLDAALNGKESDCAREWLQTKDGEQ